ncbi:uncharacterized protein BKA78DRAFT_130229 [Phyllosticta capitalensis]|uniref:uncharacterized protein n=1 Tax=Phyllosticta capitalensis TaxID=121624 RepID=UPI00312CCA01
MRAAGKDVRAHDWQTAARQAGGSRKLYGPLWTRPKTGIYKSSRGTAFWLLLIIRLQLIDQTQSFFNPKPNKPPNQTTKMNPWYVKESTLISLLGPTPHYYRVSLPLHPTFINVSLPQGWTDAKHEANIAPRTATASPAPTTAASAPAAPAASTKRLDASHAHAVLALRRQPQ